VLCITVSILSIRATIYGPQFLPLGLPPVIPYNMKIPVSAPDYLLLVTGYDGLGPLNETLSPLTITTVSLKTQEITDVYQTNITCDKYYTFLDDLYIKGMMLLGSFRLKKYGQNTFYTSFESLLIQIDPTSGSISILDSYTLPFYNNPRSFGLISIGSDNFNNGTQPPTVLYATEEPSSGSIPITPYLITITPQPKINITRLPIKPCCIVAEYIQNGLSFYSQDVVDLWGNGFLMTSLLQFNSRTGKVLHYNDSTQFGGVFAVVPRNSFDGYQVTTNTGNNYKDYIAVGVQGFNYAHLEPTSDILYFEGIGEASNYVVGGPVLQQDNLFFSAQAIEGTTSKDALVQVKVKDGQLGAHNLMNFDTEGTRGAYALVTANSQVVVALSTSVNNTEAFSYGVYIFPYD